MIKIYPQKSQKTHILEDESGIRFASEVKALLAYDERPAQLDPIGLADYVMFQYPLEDRTLFRGIKSLQPGTTLLYKPKGSKRRTYWSIPMDEVDYSLTFEKASEQFRALLHDSVRLQLRSDVPVGCHLSGGMDTAAIACLASRLAPQPLHSFTGGFSEGGIYDDRAYARTTARAAGAVFHETVPTVDDFIQWFPRLIRFMDYPVAGSGLFPQFFVSRLASQNVKVALGGQGADEMMGGYARHYLFCFEQLLVQEATGRHVSTDLTLADLSPALTQLKNYFPLVKNYFQQGLGEDSASRYFQLIKRQSDIEEVFEPEFLNSLDGYDPYETFRSIFNAHPKAPLLNRALHFETTAWLPALLQVEDRVSMACSLESRVPFLDKRIAELVFRCPDSLKLKGGQTKAILRRAMQGVVPEDVLNRSDKIGFPVPIGTWSKGPLRSFVHECLLDGRAERRGIFRRETFSGLLKDNSPAERVLWGMLSLETWFRLFIDGSSVTPDSLGAKEKTPVSLL